MSKKLRFFLLTISIIIIIILFLFIILQFEVEKVTLQCTKLDSNKIECKSSSQYSYPSFEEQRKVIVTEEKSVSNRLRIYENKRYGGCRIYITIDDNVNLVLHRTNFPCSVVKQKIEPIKAYLQDPKEESINFWLIDKQHILIITFIMTGFIFVIGGSFYEKYTYKEVNYQFPKQPKSIKIKRFNDNITIIRKWVNFGNILSAVFLLFFYYILFLEIESSSIIIIFRVISLIFLYMILLHCINKTYIYVDEKVIKVRHKPLPWKGNIDLDLMQVKTLYLRKINKKQDEHYFLLGAITDNMSNKTIFKDNTSSGEEVFFIKKILEDYLNIVIKNDL